MKILGINQVAHILSWQHDAAAALVVDGKIVASAEEERFNRVRHSRGFPTEAVAYCLKEGGIRMTDIDVIAVGYNPYAFFKRFRIPLNPGAFLVTIGNILIFERKLHGLTRATGARVVYVDHHEAHAASAYHCSGYDDANILTIDGAGETETFAYFFGKGGKIQREWDIPLDYGFSSELRRSFGMAYTSMTSLLGLGAHAEGKTMGLASYGKPQFDFSDIMDVKTHADYILDRLGIRRKFQQYSRGPKDHLTQVHKDLAASLQQALEDSVVNLAREAHRHSGSKNFSLAGGIALNCNTNQKILDQDFCEHLFVQPAANDSGVALGAALSAAERFGEPIPSRMLEHAYWGPEYSDAEIEKVLQNAKVAYTKPTHLEKNVAELLAEGKVVGWFQGRMEMGPRALGNRSILGNPTLVDTADRVNEHVKHREKWRPFAPAVTAEEAATYFDGLGKEPESSFMLRVSYVREPYRAKLPSITHVDGSARIQTVRKEQNPRLYALLEEAKKQWGMPVVLNTSFNDAGEPIVCSPRDALRCYASTGLDALALGPFLLRKS